MQEKMSEQKLREILETAEVDAGNGTLFGVAKQREPEKKTFETYYQYRRQRKIFY